MKHSLLRAALFLLLGFNVLHALPAHAQTWVQAEKIVTGAQVKGVVYDAAGNRYETGGFQGTLIFGSLMLTTAGGYDIYIVKYGSAGNMIWAKRAGGTGNQEYGNDIAIDSAGNAYITGYFSGTANFGGISLTSAGGNDIFNAKYDP